MKLLDELYPWDFPDRKYEPGWPGETPDKYTIYPTADNMQFFVDSHNELVRFFNDLAENLQNDNGHS